MDMKALIGEAKRSLATDGLLVTLYRILRYPRVLRLRAKILQGSTEERFTRIYELNAWTSQESRSGRGSELEATEKVRRHLPIVLERFDIQSMLDAPCGDFNWMQHVVRGTGLRYVGGDIVRPLIEENNRRHASESISFVSLDIIRDPLPPADLMFVRDCLFHFSLADVWAFLENFSKSEIAYLLTTTHLGAEVSNGDIETGGFRLLDLFAEPFSLPPEPLYRFDDFIPTRPPREMCLFTREQVASAIARRHRTAAA